MLASENGIQKEEVVFYLDLSTDFLKKKILLRAIENFIEKKKEHSKLSSFGIVLFLAGKDLLTLYNKYDVEEITDFIDEIWNEREQEKSYFENGLYEILAHIFKKTRKEPRKYQVIVLSDRPSRQLEDYHTSLYNLVLKATNFPINIDVIRIGNKESIDEKFMGDEVKLKVITSETFGGLLYCEHSKKLLGVLESLVKDKKQFNIVEAKKSQVREEDKTFYEKLATDLISLTDEDNHIGILCQEEKCPICDTYSDELLKCFNCNSAYHSCCAARYSLANNIGFNHIFRCIQCETLLKLDENYVDLILEEQQEETNEKLQKEKENIPSNQTYEIPFSQKKNLKTTNPEDYSGEEPLSREKESVPKKVKIGGFFGTEIEIEPNKQKKISATKSEPEIFKPEDLKSKTKGISKEKVSITSLNPPGRGGGIRLCGICGTTVKDSLYCPVCGSKLD